MSWFSQVFEVEWVAEFFLPELNPAGSDISETQSVWEHGDPTAHITALCKSAVLIAVINQVTDQLIWLTSRESYWQRRIWYQTINTVKPFRIHLQWRRARCCILVQLSSHKQQNLNKQYVFFYPLNKDFSMLHAFTDIWVSLSSY